MGGGDGGGIINFGGDGGAAGEPHRPRLDDRLQHGAAGRRDHPVRQPAGLDHARERDARVQPDAAIAAAAATSPSPAGRLDPQQHPRLRARDCPARAPNCSGAGRSASAPTSPTTPPARSPSPATTPTRLAPLRRALHRRRRDRRDPVLQRQPRARHRRHLLGDRPDRHASARPGRAVTRARGSSAGFTITGGPQGPTRRQPARVHLHGRGPGHRLSADPAATPVDGTCSSPYTVDVSLPDGDYEFRVDTRHARTISRSFTVDTVRRRRPPSPTSSSSAPSPAPRSSARSTARRSRPAPRPTAPPGSRRATTRWRSASIDLAGQRERAQHADLLDRRAAAGPDARCRPPCRRPRRPPEPVRNKSVEADTEGTVTLQGQERQVRRRSRTGGPPNGAEIDAKRGEVTITTSTGERPRSPTAASRSARPAGSRPRP